MFLGLALVLGALLWARDIRRKSRGVPTSFRGPWIMGLTGAVVFVFYLWLVTHGALE
ncbi:MAG: hypothetical protein KDI88_00510 [Gammaproteobacteria bacterium]|nr:hypothetical protein [Gammaproteobacteria bacterium]